MIQHEREPAVFYPTNVLFIQSNELLMVSSFLLKYELKLIEFWLQKYNFNRSYRVPILWKCEIIQNNSVLAVLISSA